MSRSGYDDDFDGTELNLYRGAVKSAIRGKRGQTLLHELVLALEAMPVKELIDGALEREGQVCALGAVGLKRGMDISSLDPYDAGTVAASFDIAYSMACEVAWVNDEGFYSYARETPAQRWERVYKWAQQHLKGVPND